MISRSHILAAFLCLICWSAEAQQPSRKQAEVSMLPATEPQEFDLLDKTGHWAQFGAINTATHTFTPTGAGGGGGALSGAVGGSVNATSGSMTVTLPAVSGKTTSICGFTITSGGTTTPLVVNATITGTVIPILNLQYVYPSSGQGILGTAYPACIPASAVSTAITMTVPGGGAGTIAALVVWGSQQ